MKQINPYNFVPLEDEGPDRTAGYPGRHRYQTNRYSGTLCCYLESITPLITIDQRKVGSHTLSSGKGAIKVYSFMKDHRGNPMIPGSSLKGMIRSVFETITSSCLVLACTEGNSVKTRNDIRPYFYKIPEAYLNKKCCDITALCPACRLFGTIEGDTLHCQGRVSFSDADMTEGHLVKSLTYLKELSNPKPHHHATYGKSRSPSGPMAGRKFYYHHGRHPVFSVDEKDSTNRSSAVDEIAPPGCVFEFTVSVENLNADELERLILTIELVDGLGHKIGLGKAVGLGSCRISIDREKSTLFMDADRYNGYETTVNTDWHNLKADRNKLPAALIEVLRLNKHEDGGIIGYPDYRHGYPSDPIDALGVFDGNAQEGSTPDWPLAAASGPSCDTPPEVRPGEETAWLKELYPDKLILESPAGEKITRPRNAFQGKAQLLVPGNWFILSGEKSVHPLKR